jgi:peptidoglycan/LPS O-acetylase OafA/YrhL
MQQLTEVLPGVKAEAAHAPGRFYQPELDGLRFYAFLGVFVFHTVPSQASFYRSLHLPLPGLWAAVAKSGAAGVDLFFTLSAFLITSLLLRERHESGGISLRLFYIRRILRIWPLYFAMLALGIVLAHTMAKQSLPWYYVAGFVLFIGNWVSAVCGHPESICAPMWTVSIEEQFYLLWPLLMKMLKPKSMIVAASATFVLATISQIGIALAGLSGGYIYYGSVSRCAPLALGVLLALCADHLPQLTSSLRWLLVAGGLMGWVVASAWLLDQPGPVDMRMVLGRLVVSLAAAAMLLGCLYSRNRLVRAGWIVKLGKISYGLYMLHLAGILIPLSLLHPAVGWKLLAVKALGLMTTILLALASYRWIESPFLRLKDRFAVVHSRPI